MTTTRAKRNKHSKNNPADCRVANSEPRTSGSILQAIVETTRRQLAERKAIINQEALSRRARATTPARDFVGALRRTPESGVNIIAELKRASPSKGLIRESFKPLELARQLAANGAAALSILTEPVYFKGSLRLLRIIADNIELPLLRKDFIIDSYQVYESRLYGADAILLIAAALRPEQFSRLARLAREIGMAVLAEIHTETELQWVLELYPDLIGVNSRDLSTFNVDLDRTASLLQQIPSPIVRIAESGITSHQDISRLEQVGCDAFLIGESLMRNHDPGQKLRALRGNPE